MGFPEDDGTYSKLKVRNRRCLLSLRRHGYLFLIKAMEFLHYAKLGLARCWTAQLEYSVASFASYFRITASGLMPIAPSHLAHRMKRLSFHSTICNQFHVVFVQRHHDCVHDFVLFVVGATMKRIRTHFHGR